MKITDDHRKLLREMDFVLDSQSTEAPFLRTDYKRPFGNSDYHHDIAWILNWELPNDDLSFDQLKRANELMSELPEALFEILHKAD